MSHTYTRKARRYLRKYTASIPSPVYAAAIDAERISQTLCDVPWNVVSADEAGFSAHDADTLDDNVANRDFFDAALFCSGHTGGKHLAHANAACYLIKLPDNAAGATLESLSVSAASDPYNAAGLRVAVLTAPTDAIPTDCAVCRAGGYYDPQTSSYVTGDAYHVAGAIPRTSTTATNGDVTWFAASGTVTLSPSLTAQKYLMLIVALENYSMSRGNWLEGSGYIRNSISLTFNREIDWSEIDAAAEENTPKISVISGGVLAPRPQGDLLGSRLVRLPAYGGVAGLHFAYHCFLSDSNSEIAILPAAKDSNNAATPAQFRLRRVSLARTSNPDSQDDWEIEGSLLLAPAVMPDAFSPSKVQLSFSSLSLPDGAWFAAWIIPDFISSPPADLLANPRIWDARANAGDWRLMGKFSTGTQASFQLSADESAARYLTVAISAYFPPEAVNPSTLRSWQGTPALIPDISIV